MDEIPYESNAFYIFDKEYYNLARLYRIQCISSMFIIRTKEHLKYEIISGNNLLDGNDNVLIDQTIRLKDQMTKKKSSSELRRIVFYTPELKRTFTFFTNYFTIKDKDVAMFYKQRWLVELFFGWIKQYLRVLSI